MVKKKRLEETAVCHIGKLIVEGHEIPIAVCQLGEKIDIRVPDKTMLKDLFKKKVKI